MKVRGIVERAYHLPTCRFSQPPCLSGGCVRLAFQQALPNGNFEVGVHIADVSYFVQPGTAVDKEAQLRCTSTYLVQVRGTATSTVGSLCRQPLLSGVVEDRNAPPDPHLCLHRLLLLLLLCSESYPHAATRSVRESMQFEPQR